MKKTFAIISVVFVCLLLVGCDGERQKGEAVVYGVTGAYPVRIEMEVDGDQKVSSVKIDEYLSIYDIGELERTEQGLVKYGVAVPSKDGFAQKVRIGDKIFEYKNGRYFDDAEQDYADYIEQNEAQYMHAMSIGDFDIVDENGADLNVPFNVYDGHKIKKTEWADKMKNGYHEGNEYPIGWKEDMYNLILHIKNHGFYSYTGSEKAKEGESFKVGKYDTMVSQKNFHDYMQLAKKAFLLACENVK